MTAAGTVEKSSLSKIFSNSMSLRGMWKNLILESANCAASDLRITTASSVLILSFAVMRRKQSFAS